MIEQFIFWSCIIGSVLYIGYRFKTKKKSDDNCSTKEVVGTIIKARLCLVVKYIRIKM